MTQYLLFFPEKTLGTRRFEPGQAGWEAWMPLLWYLTLETEIKGTIPDSGEVVFKVVIDESGHDLEITLLWISSSKKIYPSHTIYEGK